MDSCQEVIDLAMRPGEPRETRVAVGVAEKRGESPRKEVFYSITYIYIYTENVI